MEYFFVVCITQIVKLKDSSMIVRDSKSILLERHWRIYKCWNLNLKSLAWLKCSIEDDQMSTRGPRFECSHRSNRRDQRRRQKQRHHFSIKSACWTAGRSIVQHSNIWRQNGRSVNGHTGHAGRSIDYDDFLNFDGEKRVLSSRQTF